MEEKKRMFKLRNGLIVEEALDGHKNHFNFLPDQSGEKEDSVPWYDTHLALILDDNNDGFLDGGAHGMSYDIVEELFLETKNK